MMMDLRVRRSERGVTLAEVLIALFILGFVGVAVIAGVFTTVKGNETARTRITAESLARSELEYVNSQNTPGDWTYVFLPPDYANYSVAVSSTTLEEPIVGRQQRITAVVSYKDDDILTIETWRFEE
jgi:Tfp pilus assembly protein PilV